MPQRGLVQAGLMLWAAPWTLLGLAFGLLGLVSGGRAGRQGFVLEFSGGVLSWLLRRMPIPGGAMAVTIGHVILGQSRDALDQARAHELVHVRQYERWGPLFVPAYLICSLLVWLEGKDAYRDNPFEREAYGIEQEAP